MEKEKSPLEELLVDERKLVEDTLKKVLTPLVGLSRDSDKIVPKTEFQQLTIKQRIVAYLLARQAMKMLNIAGASEKAASDRIATDIMADRKTVGEQLSRLKKELIERSDGGEWFLPNSKITLAADFLKRRSD